MASTGPYTREKLRQLPPRFCFWALTSQPCIKSSCNSSRPALPTGDCINSLITLLFFQAMNILAQTVRLLPRLSARPAVSWQETSPHPREECQHTTNRKTPHLSISSFIPGSAAVLPVHAQSRLRAGSSASRSQETPSQLLSHLLQNGEWYKKKNTRNS